MCPDLIWPMHLCKAERFGHNDRPSQREVILRHKETVHLPAKKLAGRPRALLISWFHRARLQNRKTTHLCCLANPV